jgi:hypothetical protein
MAKLERTDLFKMAKEEMVFYLAYTLILRDVIHSNHLGNLLRTIIEGTIGWLQTKIDGTILKLPLFCSQFRSHTTFMSGELQRAKWHAKEYVQMELAVVVSQAPAKHPLLELRHISIEKGNV